MLLLDYGGRQGANRPVRAVLNPNHPLTNKLVAWVVGSEARDVISGKVLTGIRDLVPYSQAGLTRRFNAAGEGIEVTAPGSVRLPYPITVAAWFVPTGTIEDNAGIFGVAHNNADGAPFYSYGLSYNASIGMYSVHDSGGFQQINTGGIIPTTGVLELFVAVFEPAAVSLYLGGRLITTGAGTTTDATFDATALLFAGNYTGISRNSNINFVEGRIWNRALTSSDVRALYDPKTRWSHYLTPRVGTWEELAAAPTTRPHLMLLGVS